MSDGNIFELACVSSFLKKLSAVNRSSPAVQADRTALASALERALARIRPEHRNAIILHYQEGLGHAEISAILGVPVGTVKTYLHRGRKELAEWASLLESCADAIEDLISDVALT